MALRPDDSGRREDSPTEAFPADDGGLGGPRYFRVAQTVLADIVSGRFAGATKLPTERALANDLRVSRATVVAAYDLLAEAGVVTRRQGSGTWLEPGPIPYSVLAKFGAAAKTADVISFALANLPAPDLVAEAFDRARATALQEHLTTQGYASHGVPALRELLADYYTQKGLPTTPNQVLVTSGAQQAIYLIASLLLEPGDLAVVEDPTYSGALDALRGRGAEVIGFPRDSFGRDVKALATKLAGKRALIYVMPVHNPTGGLLSAEEHAALTSIVSDSPHILIEDRTLANLTFSDSAPPPIATDAPGDRVFLIESLSKVVWGGLRVGWVRADSSMIESLARTKAMIDLACPVISQLVAAELIPNLDSAAEVACGTARGRLAFLQDTLRRFLPSWSWSEPRGGLSLWTKLPSGVAADFLQVAMQYQVSAVDGSLMSPSGTYRDHIRLPYVHDPAVTAEGIARLAEAWRAYEQISSRHGIFKLVT